MRREVDLSSRDLSIKGRGFKVLNTSLFEPYGYEPGMSMIPYQADRPGASDV